MKFGTGFILLRTFQRSFGVTILGRHRAPPVAHLEGGLLTHLHIGHGQRRLFRHDLAEGAGHEPTHPETPEQIRHGVLAAVIRSLVVAGQQKAIALAEEDESFLVAPRRQAGGDGARERPGLLALADEDGGAADGRIVADNRQASTEICRTYCCKSRAAAATLLAAACLSINCSGLGSDSAVSAAFITTMVARGLPS